MATLYLFLVLVATSSVNPYLACEQAFQGGLAVEWEKVKESLPLCLWNLNICIKNVDLKCQLAEMTLVMASFPLAHVFQGLLTFALVSASHWWAEI